MHSLCPRHIIGFTDYCVVLFLIRTVPVKTGTAYATNVPPARLLYAAAPRVSLMIALYLFSIRSMCLPDFAAGTFLSQRASHARCSRPHCGVFFCSLFLRLLKNNRFLTLFFAILPFPHLIFDFPHHEKTRNSEFGRDFKSNQHCKQKYSSNS